jgi:hypothetical protein
MALSLIMQAEATFEKGNFMRVILRMLLYLIKMGVIHFLQQRWSGPMSIINKVKFLINA